MKIQKGKQGGPRRVLFHGTNFVGKTTFASEAFGGCLLINLEDDKDVDMDKTPPVSVLQQVALKQLLLTLGILRKGNQLLTII